MPGKGPLRGSVWDTSSVGLQDEEHKQHGRYAQ